MRYSERLLLDAQAEYERAQLGIRSHAKDLDALGKLLNAMRFEWATAQIGQHDSRIVLCVYGGQEHAALLFLLDCGATVERRVEVNGYMAHTLAVPDIGIRVVMHIPPLSPSAEAMAMHAPEAA